MLPVLLTSLFALYVLGPDLIFRWIVGFFAPSRVRARSYGEQIAVASVLALVPILLSWEITHRACDVYASGNKLLLRGFLDGIFAQESFDKHSSAFYQALPFIWRVNRWCFFLVYTQVCLMGFAVGKLTANLGKATRWLDLHPKLFFLRRPLTAITMPWAAEWHLRLSRMLLPSKGTLIQADILTSLDVLYRGTLVRHHLGMDGELISVTVEDARKFRRQELVDDRNEWKHSYGMVNTGNLLFTKIPTKPDANDYWSKIPGTFFVIKADEIISMNVRYVETVSDKDAPVTKTSVDTLLAALVEARSQEKATGQ